MGQEDAVSSSFPAHPASAAERAGVPNDLRNRIRTLVRVAADNDSTVSSDELRALLPADAFAGTQELGRFLADDPVLSSEFAVIGGEVVPRDATALIALRSEQRRLSEERLATAGRYAHRLSRMCPGIDLVAISGSTAYGGAKPHDDIDFFIVARRNRMWLTLLLAMGLARLERLRNPSAPVFCFNRVTERDPCASSFRESRDPLFAREALNLRVLQGHAFYADLIRRSPWMRNTFPALYRERLQEVFFKEDESTRTTGPAGLLGNAAAFAVLAPYLWLAGLARNVGLSRAGRSRARFRTVIAWAFCAYESQKYEDLRDAYRRSF